MKAFDAVVRASGRLGRARERYFAFMSSGAPEDREIAGRMQEERLGRAVLDACVALGLAEARVRRMTERALRRTERAKRLAC